MKTNKCIINENMLKYGNEKIGKKIRCLLPEKELMN